MEEDRKVSPRWLAFESTNYQEPLIEKEFEKLKKTIYWLLYNEKGDVKGFMKYLLTARSEINMKYYQRDCIVAERGDVVTCNFGIHARSEISGGYVHAIVCDIRGDGLVYLVPIIRKKMTKDEKRFIPFYANQDMYYFDEALTDGTVRINRGMYVASERINSIVGQCDPNFFRYILLQIPKALTFFKEEKI